MPRLALTGGAYQARSVIASAQRSLNLYPEPMPQQQGEPAPVAHNPTPGLTLLGALPQNGVRGIRQATTGGIYAVAGSGVYLVNPSGWTSTLLGSITQLRPYPVSMADNGNTLVIVDGTAGGWTVNLASNAFAAISDPAFYGADRVDYLDTYFLFNKPGTPQFYSSDSLATTFDPLWFANKESVSDLLVTLCVSRREIWLLGTKVTEVWYDAGSPDFPFGEVPGIFVDHGCAAKYSVAEYDNTVYWLGTNPAGQGIVLTGFGGGYLTKRISTFAIEEALRTYPTISDAIGFVYSLGGHVCYVLTFPTADHTWAYDIITGEWHEWLWIDNDGHEHRHRANCCYNCNGMPIVGDWQNGNLYKIDADAYTDNGQPIKRVRSFPHVLNDLNRVYYREFIADIESGNEAQGETLTLPPPVPSGPSGYVALPRGTGHTNGQTNATSSDGGVTVGWVSPTGYDFEYIACYWVGQTGPFLLYPDIDSQSAANGVSAGGSVIVGTLTDTFPSTPNGQRPFVWTAATGAIGFASYGLGNAVSADGSTLVGCQFADYTGAQSQATWWDRATLTQHDLGYLPGHTNSSALACSGDGSVIVGWSGPHANPTAAGTKAFRWTAATGMVDLGFIASPDFPGQEYFMATGVSNDGTIVAGSQKSNVSLGFRWTAATGMVSIPTGQTGSDQSVSGDGTTFITAYGDAMGYWSEAGGLVIPPVTAFDPELPGEIPITWAQGINHNGGVIACNGFQSSNNSYIPCLYYVPVPSAGGQIIASVGNRIFLDWSDDRGHSYGNPVGQAIGAPGRYLTSVQWQRLGYARDRIFRLTWSVPVKTALQGAFISVDASEKT